MKRTLTQIILVSLFASSCYAMENKTSAVEQEDTITSISIEEPTGIARFNAPVRSGIPFAKGQLPESQGLELYTGDQQLPLRYRPLSVWDDGSVRWLLLDSQVDLAAGKTSEFQLRKAKAMSPGSGVTITTSRELFIVDTGAIQVEIPRLHGGIIHRIMRDGVTIVNTPLDLTEMGPYVNVSSKNRTQSYFGALLTSKSVPLPTDRFSVYKQLVTQSGRADYNTYDPFDLDVSIEESNALHSVIRVSGAHMSRSGKAFSTFILRLHFYKNKSFFDIDHTLVYTGEETEQVVSYGFKLPFKGSKTFIDGKRSNTGELLHDEYRNFSLAGKRFEGQAAGFVSRQNSGNTLSIFLRDMAEKFPKALVATDKSLDVQLYPDSVVDWDLTKYTPQCGHSDFQSISDPARADCTFPSSQRGGLVPYSRFGGEIATRQGETRRHYFERGAQGISLTDNYRIQVDNTSFDLPRMENQALILDAGPLRIMTPSNWYSEAGVMGIGPFVFETDIKKSEGHYRIDRILKVVEDFMRVNQRKQYDWFGLEDYGDIRGRFFGGKGDSHSWSTKGRYGWSGNSGETSNQLWVQYLRKPSQQLFRDAEALARHTLDQQTVHFADLDCGDNDDCEKAGYALVGLNRFSTVGSIHRHGVQAWSGYAGSPDYSHVAGVETYYYLTGDARAKEVLYEQAHFIMRQYSDRTGLQNGLDVLDRAIAVHYQDEATVTQFEERAQGFIDYMAADQGAGWNGVQAYLIDYDNDGLHDRDDEGKSNLGLYWQGFEFFMRGAPGLLYRHERLQEAGVGQLILDAADILTMSDGDDWDMGLDGQAGSLFYQLNTLSYAAHIANSMGVSKTPYYNLAKRGIEFNTHGGTDTNDTSPISLSALQAIPEDWNDWQWTWDEDDEVAIGDPGILWLARQITYRNNFMQDYHSYRAFLHMATAAAMVEQGKMQLR